MQTLPHSEEAERALLAACLVDQEVLAEWAHVIKPAHFWEQRAAWCWEAMQALHAAGRAVDVLTIDEQLRGMKRDQEVGSLLTDALNELPTAINAGTYARIVQEMAERRRIIRSLGPVAKAAHDTSQPMASVREQFLNAPLDVVELDAERVPLRAAQVAAELSDWLERMQARDYSQGVITGWADLDRLQGPMEPGELIVLGARPGMGKSTLVNNLVDHISRTRRMRTAVFSIEMQRRLWVMRTLASVADVDFDKLRQAQIGPDDWEKVTRGLIQISDSTLHIDDQPSIDTAAIRLKARRLKQREGLDLVVVDYLQLVDAADSDEGQGRHIQVGNIARDLKLLARELEVPVVAIAMVGRDVEKRADRRPMMSDIGESSKVEAHTDRIWFLYRDEYYNPETAAKGQAELIVAKNRNGATGRVVLGWDKRRQRFVDIVRERMTL